VLYHTKRSSIILHIYNDVIVPLLILLRIIHSFNLTLQ